MRVDRPPLLAHSLASCLDRAWHEAVVAVAALVLVRPMAQSSAAEAFQTEPFQVEPFRAEPSRAEPSRAARTWSVPVVPETVQAARTQHRDDAASVAWAADDRPLLGPAVQTVRAHRSFAFAHC